MNLYAETALIALAGVGAFTVLSKLQDAMHYFRSEVTSEPTCYGDYRPGQHHAERDCTHCPFQSRCREQALANLVAAQCEIELQPAITNAVFSAVINTDSLNPSYGVVAPSDKPKWDACGDKPLKQVPPNMGGLDSKVPYAGPNYVSEDEMVEIMRPTPYYFSEGGDLAWEYEFGRVAGDGCIWTAPDERVATGIVRIHASEMTKASRFGWQFVGDADTPGYVMAQKD